MNDNEKNSLIVVAGIAATGFILTVISVIAFAPVAVDWFVKNVPVFTYP